MLLRGYWYSSTLMSEEKNGQATWHGQAYNPSFSGG